MSSLTDPERNITVITSDKRRFEVPLKVLRSSSLFNSALENSQFDIAEEFEISEVNGDVFEKVLEWCRHHEGHPQLNIEVDPHTRERRWFSFSEFQHQFFRLSIEELEDLIMAADYLNIQSLYLYSCQAAAAQLKGKSPEEIRSLLGLPDDLSNEEKDSIRRENVWCSYNN